MRSSSSSRPIKGSILPLRARFVRFIENRSRAVSRRLWRTVRGLLASSSSSSSISSSSSSSSSSWVPSSSLKGFSFSSRPAISLIPLFAKISFKCRRSSLPIRLGSYYSACKSASLSRLGPFEVRACKSERRSNPAFLNQKEQ